MAIYTSQTDSGSSRKRHLLRAATKTLKELLTNYQPFDTRDAKQARRLAEFVATHPNAFERSNPEGHITASAWLLDPTGTKVLLTHHKKIGKWLQLGGHADGNKDTLAAAMREAKEESGLDDIEVLSDQIFDVDVHLIPAYGPDPAHYHYDVRYLLQAKSTKVKLSHESKELAWVDLNRLSDYSSEKSLHRMAFKCNLMKRLSQ